MYITIETGTTTITFGGKTRVVSYKDYRVLFPNCELLENVTISFPYKNWLQALT
jgi:hypothetical protein